MKIGLHLLSDRGSERWTTLRHLARFAEAEGCTHLFFGDNPLRGDDLTLRMLEAGRATESLTVGAGATNAVLRHPSGLLRAHATLADLLGPGRVFLGLGSGDGSLRTLGLRAMNLRQMEDTICDMRRWLLGDQVRAESDEVTMLGVTQVPIYVFAEGPRMVSLAARLADALVYGGGISAEAIEWVHAHASVERAAAAGPLDIWFCAVVSIADTQEQAQEAIASRIAPRARRNVKSNPILADEGAVEELESGHVSTRMFSRFGLVGTVDQVRERVEELRDLGVERLMLDFMPGTVEPQLPVFMAQIDRE